VQEEWCLTVEGRCPYVTPLCVFWFIRKVKIVFFSLKTIGDSQLVKKGTKICSNLPWEREFQSSTLFTYVAWDLLLQDHYAELHSAGGVYITPLLCNLYFNINMTIIPRIQVTLTGEISEDSDDRKATIVMERFPPSERCCSCNATPAHLQKME
jgi:hypothetical protein